MHTQYMHTFDSLLVVFNAPTLQNMNAHSTVRFGAQTIHSRIHTQGHTHMNTHEHIHTFTHTNTHIGANTYMKKT